MASILTSADPQTASAALHCSTSLTSGVVRPSDGSTTPSKRGRPKGSKNRTFRPTASVPPKPPIDRLLIGLDDAACVLGIGRSTFHKLLASGKGPQWLMVGRKRMFAIATLRAWVAQGEQIAASSSYPAMPASLAYRAN